MSRDIIGTVKLVAKCYPENPETVSDAFQIEVQLRADGLFREGQPVTGAYSIILQELPDSISAKDKARVLSIVMETWNFFRLERGGGRWANSSQWFRRRFWKTRG